MRRLFWTENKTPLIADDLVTAIRWTSRERVEEIEEEYPGLVRMENLRGMKLPLGRQEVVERLGKPQPQEPPGLPVSGEAILSELMLCGALRPGEGGLLDVPDIFRYAFEITPNYAKAWEDLLLVRWGSLTIRCRVPPWLPNAVAGPNRDSSLAPSSPR